MTKFQAKQRIEKLKKLINHHRYQYHVLNKQEISDAALDSLKHELFELEQKFPDLITKDSPTQRVAGEPLKRFKKVKHSQRMISLEDIFTYKELEEWQTRIKKLFPTKNYDYFAELKIDGLAINLKYENGKLVQGSTRGNGLVGEDVTQNVKTIEAIPLDISDYANKAKIKLPKVIEIRGEVYMTKKEFNRVNKEQEKKGLQLYANPRNLAAGTIRQLDSKITASRKLSFFAYEMVSDLGQKTHQQVHEICRKLGFSTVPFEKYCANLKQIENFKDLVYEKRDSFNYWIDGIVIQVNNTDLKQKLGIVGKAPRGMIAYKFPAEQTTTKVKNVKIQVGRHGALTPVAELEPVLIAGTTVSNATLHNFDEVKRLGLKIGDTVIIQKAGDIIPQVVKVLPELRTGNEKTVQIPKKCPICGDKVIQKPGEVAVFCANKQCFAIEKEKFNHFVSKKAFDIEGLGPKIVEQLINEGLVSDYADLFTLTKGDLEPLERFADKSAENLIQAINKSKIIDLNKFIYSLGIKHVGEQTAIDLALAFKNIENLRKTNLEQLENISDIGPKVAQSIVDWFKISKNQELVDKLLKNQIKIVNPKKTSNKLQNKIFVLTGSLESMTRDQAKEKIRSLGGSISSSVSKSTDYVVTGKKPGSKYDKAKKLGVTIISEKELTKLF